MRQFALILCVLMASGLALAEAQNGLTAAATQAAAAATQDAPKAPASKPVAEKGISGVLTVSKAAFAANEDLKFTVTVRNDTDKGWLLHDVAYFWQWDISLKNVTTGDTWKVRSLFEAKRQSTDTMLDPGKSVELAAQLRHAGDRPFDFVTKKGDKIETARTLPAGLYKLQVNINVSEVITAQSEYQPWKGVIKTGEVEFEITEAVK